MKLLFISTVLTIVSLQFISLSAQTDSCVIAKSLYSDLRTVNSDKLKCIAQQSEKEYTLFYTFGIWCSPCRKKLEPTIQFAKENNVDFYILLVDNEADNYYVGGAMRYLLDIDSTMNMVILSDSLYGVKSKKKLIDIGAGGGKKYKKFLREICGTDLEPVYGMSIGVLINRQGKVVDVNYSSEIINNKISK